MSKDFSIVPKRPIDLSLIESRIRKKDLIYERAKQTIIKLAEVARLDVDKSGISCLTSLFR
jgi:hypothetical protein